MADQLEEERRLTGDAGFVTLMKEMIFIPGNRKRMIISIILMISQQVRLGGLKNRSFSRVA